MIQHRHRSVLIMTRALLQKGFSKRKMFHIKRTCFLFVALHETRFAFIQINKYWNLFDTKACGGHAASACLSIHHAGTVSPRHLQPSRADGLVCSSGVSALTGFPTVSVCHSKTNTFLFICKATFQPLSFTPPRKPRPGGSQVWGEAGHPRDFTWRLIQLLPCSVTRC